MDLREYSLTFAPEFFGGKQLSLKPPSPFSAIRTVPPPFVGLPLISVRKKSRIFAPYSQIRWKTGNDLRHLLCSKVVEREPGDDFRALELGTRGELSNLSSFQRRPYQYHLTWQEKLSIPRYLLRPQPDVTPATTAVAQPDVTPATTAAG